MVDLAEDSPAVTGAIEGSQDYDVVLEVEGDDQVGRCDCPMGETGAFCKHLVALGLAWLAQAVEPAGRTAADCWSAPSRPALAGTATHRRREVNGRPGSSASVGPPRGSPR